MQGQRMDHHQVAQPDFWRCKTCGCLWRDNHDDTVSLTSAKQTSCEKCEWKPCADVCEPLYLRPAEVDATLAAKDAEFEEVQDSLSRTLKFERHYKEECVDLRAKLAALRQSVETIQAENVPDAGGFTPFQRLHAHMAGNKNAKALVDRKTLEWLMRCADALDRILKELL